MNILYIGNALSSSGKTPTTIETLGDLLERDHKVTIKSRIKNKGLRLLDMIWSVLSNRKRTDVVLIDVYSSSAFYFAWFCARMSKFLGIPYIPIVHGGSLSYRLKSSPRMAYKLFTGAWKVVTPSDFLANALRDFNVSSEIIRNPIDIESYDFGTWTTKPNVLWVRSIAKIYNPAMALRVLKDIRTVYPDAKLTMVGPEKDISIKELRVLSKELGVENNVKFTGLLPKAEWIKLSKDHSFFINTTNVDNAPVSVVEAMALGLLVISTNVGGIPFMIEDQKNGFLVEPDDHQSMADIIINQCNPAESGVNVLREAARNFSKEFDNTTVLKEWNNLLSSD